MSFTPLVSPAVTPLESQFPVEAQFTVPGAYFSPLSSPALHAQADPGNVFDPRITSGGSPADMDLEPSASGDLAKKRKMSLIKAKKPGMRQSPIAKPQRKRTSIMNSQTLDHLAETIECQRQLTSGSSTSGATDSENGSVSPEALSDMPPPPVPRSRSGRPSPYMQPQIATRLSPATPASLMRLPAKVNSAVQPETHNATEAIDNFELPESLNVNFQKAAQPLTASPPLDASSSKAFQPLPSPVFAKPTIAASASQSPQLMAGAGLRKTPLMLPRGSKKRTSVGSVQVSPALRPKISPNIKPLLPGGATAEDQASRLLASKSNYQNILEGNTVPGVSYPSELSTNLTSKRTSHKIAEQGRRNRINSALQEIATRLPRPPKECKGGDMEGGDKAGKHANMPNSKASTVEMAIEDGQQLKKEVTEATRRAGAAEKKHNMKVA